MSYNPKPPNVKLPSVPPPAPYGRAGIEDIPRCEYCRQVFIASLRGGCVCCGAPAPDSNQGIIPIPMNAPMAILKVKGSLSDAAIERIRAQWEALFTGASHPQLIILEEDMDIQFVQQGIFTRDEVRGLMGFDEFEKFRE